MLNMLLAVRWIKKSVEKLKDFRKVIDYDSLYCYGSSKEILNLEKLIGLGINGAVLSIEV